MYPIELSLKDDTKVVIRPLLDEDYISMREFFSAIPREDLFICKDDVVRWEPIENWFVHLSHERVVELVTLRNNEILAKGTLYAQDRYCLHAAELKLIVRPDCRGLGIGSRMFDLLFHAGLSYSFHKMISRYFTDNLSFINILGHYDFEPETVLQNYVLYEAANEWKDLVTASCNMRIRAADLKLQVHTARHP
ncbi:MAG: GNAT family N-acetyltransferase [Thermodesulfobacteriota bacterium]